MNQKHNREDIIAVGAELVRRNGYHATGINDILREAGIPKGSFYNFFPTKEAYVREVLAWYASRMEKAMRKIFSQTDMSAVARLKKFYRLVIAGNAEEGFQNGCLLNNLSIEVAGKHDLLAEEADYQFNRWVDEIETLVREGQQSGEISTRFPARETAEFIHTAFYGAFARMKSTRDESTMATVYTMMFDSICL